MNRWLIRTIFFIPILLCIVSWIYGSTHYRWLQGNFGDYWMHIDPSNGALSFAAGSNRDAATWNWRWMGSSKAGHLFWPHQGENISGRLGFKLWYGQDRVRSWFGLTVPYWLLILLFALFLVIAWRISSRAWKPARAFPMDLVDSPTTVRMLPE